MTEAFAASVFQASVARDTTWILTGSTRADRVLTWNLFHDLTARVHAGLSGPSSKLEDVLRKWFRGILCAFTRLELIDFCTLGKEPSP